MPKKANAKPAYSKADMKAVSDNPEWTKADFAKAKPFAEVFPELAKTINRRGPQKAPTKEAVNIRLSAVVLQHFRALGRGWQTEIDDTLLQAIRKKAKRKAG
jgi:uncharacterized protein (DUF4415 family)